MFEILQRGWWIFLLRGVAAIVFGVMAIAWPALTLASLVLLFGVYMLVDGVIGLIEVIRRRDSLNRVWLLVLDSVLGIAVGLVTLLWPGVTALVLLVFIALWAIAGGILRILVAVRIRHEIRGEWFLIAGGLLSVLFGGLLIAMPGAGLVTLAWLIGLYALAFGALFVALALRLRRLRERIAADA